YRATVDWPGCLYYRELMAAFPQAKLILTVRDAQRWYDSVRDTLYSLKTATDEAYLAATDAAGRRPVLQ
ncbi:sulfotransferase, partial [Escherichia coli]